MKTIKIIVDSTCDLPKQICEKYNIDVIPLIISILNKEYRDCIDIMPEEFYGMLKNLEKLPTTAMPSPDAFMKSYEKAKSEGNKEIICICMSSGTSGTYQSAVLGREYFLENNSDVEVYVLDSKCMSHGSGYLALKATEMIEDGKSYLEIVDFLEKYKKRVKHFLSVDDLNNLIKSGRLTNVSAMIGKILRVKPIMSMRDGKGAIVAKVRGRKQVFKHYLEEFNRRVDLEMTNFIIIGYSSDIEVAKELEKRLKESINEDIKIYIMQMGISVGTHVGLGGLSMYFIEKGNIHDGILTNRVRKGIDKLEETKHKLEEKKNELLKNKKI